MSENRFQTGQRLSLYCLLGNAVLTLIKAVAGIIGNSSAMLADAIHSASDFTSTIAVMISLLISRKPADSDHPYGHGRAEAIAAKLLSLMLVGIGAYAAWTSFRKVLAGQFVVPESVALWAAVLSIIIKEVMYQFSIRVGKRINSPAIIADAWHHRSDAFSSVVALLGIAGSRLGWPYLDPIAGGAVALVVIKVGVDILKTSINEVMDSQPSAEVLGHMRQAIDRVPGVQSIGRLVIRNYGPNKFLDVTVGVDGGLNVSEGHDIADQVRTTLTEEFQDVMDVLVHVDPCSEAEAVPGNKAPNLVETS